MADNKEQKLAPLTTVDDITIELSSRPAVRLWNGRKKTDKNYSVLGLPGFCKLMRGIEDSVRKDDPYADYYYHQIEIAIQNIAMEIQSERKAIEALLKETIPESMRLPEVKSRNPVVYPVRFASRIGFQMLYQILAADSVMLKHLQAHHVAVITTYDKNGMSGRLEQKIRGVMNMVFKYKHTGVTRDDMASNNKVCQKAKTQMGIIPDEYLTGEMRSDNAPFLPARRLAVIKGNIKIETEEQKPELGEQVDMSEVEVGEQQLDALIKASDEKTAKRLEKATA